MVKGPLIHEGGTVVWKLVLIYFLVVSIGFRERNANPPANNIKINSAIISETTHPKLTETDILMFVLNENWAVARVNTDTHTVIIEVTNVIDLTSSTSTITFSDGATIAPDSGIARFQYYV